MYHVNVNVNSKVENVTLIKSGITMNVGVNIKIEKNILCAKKGYIWSPVMCICENGKYVESIIANSLIICDKNIEETKITSTKPVPTKTIVAKSTSTVSIFY